jgi:hypothetical protein
MLKYSNAEQEAIMSKVRASALCDGAKWLLEVACGSFAHKCSCGRNLVSQDGEIAFTFHGGCEIKDREAKERVERAINESGIASVSFRRMPKKPGKRHVGYYVKITF